LNLIFFSKGIRCAGTLYLPDKPDKPPKIGGHLDCISVTADDKDLWEVIDKNLIPEPSELFLAPVHLQLFAYRQN
jgi:hypothetical protein